MHSNFGKDIYHLLDNQLLCISFMLKSIKGFNVRACRYQYLNTASCDINVIHKFI